MPLPTLLGVSPTALVHPQSPPLLGVSPTVLVHPQSPGLAWGPGLGLCSPRGSPSLLGDRVAAPRAGAVYCKGNEDSPGLGAGEGLCEQGMRAEGAGGVKDPQIIPCSLWAGLGAGDGEFRAPLSSPRLSQRLEVFVPPQGSAEIIPHPASPSSEKSPDSSSAVFRGRFYLVILMSTSHGS